MDEWELSKENVQPLKSGRKVANLTAALQPSNNVDQRQQIILQRQALETELRAYAGDDPIEPWDKYIRWTERTFPRGGKDSNMMVLLQRCVQQFKEETRYKNDLRYVGAWIKLASNFSNDPLEMYQFMRDQGIGFQVAAFYEAWAWQLEQVGNTKKADFVYQEGINCKAEPLSRLEALHKEFQYRIARSTMEQMQEAEYINQPTEAAAPQRSVLGGLKGKGKLQKVGTQRTGAVQRGASSGGLGLQMPSRQVGQQFAVFDENSASGASSHPTVSALPAPTGEWENMPPQEQARKENERSAGPWAGQRVRQPRAAAIGLDEVSLYSQPSFSVHVDEAPQPMMTPHKLPEMGNQVLSARKPEKRPDNTLKNIQKPMFSTSVDDKTKVMYCKHLIYGGATEMSIEELRAIRVKAKKEEQRLAAERAELKRKQELLQEQMIQKQEEFERKVQERLEQQRLKHEEEMKRFVEQQQKSVQDFQMKLMTMQPPQQAAPPPVRSEILPPQVNQENSVPNHSLPMHIGSSVDTSAFKFPAPKRAALQKVESMNIAAAAPLQPLGEGHLEEPSARKTETAKTPEEKHQMTMNKAQQQLLELKQQMQRHQLNESLCQGKELLVNNQQEHDGDQTGPISCTQQLHFDETRTVNWQQVIAQTNQPTPSFSHMKKPPPLNPVNTSIVTPNASTLFNTSSNNTSQQKTPLDHSRPDSRGSSHSGRLHSFTPHRTPGGIAAPSPTVNTKEALGAIMAMLNKSLAVDEEWRPSAEAEDLSATADNHNLDDFSSEFVKVADKPKLQTQCPFTIANDDDDEYKHLDNQENLPPKDYVAPQPDPPRPKSGILQPSVGIPVMPLESELKEEDPMEQQESHQQQQEQEGMDEAMEGIEPLKDDDKDHHQPNATHFHESTLMHHSTHSAFEAAARMASTPFNPQFGSERPSFSMSAIKAPMNSSLHQSEPVNILPPPTTDSNVPKSVPFSIFADPGPPPTTVSSEPALLPEQMKDEVSAKVENGSKLVAAARVEVSGIESFDVNETTGNPIRQLSPIMETSAEDRQSSASSSSNGSQAPSLAASQVQQQQSALINNSLHTSTMTSAKKANLSTHANSFIDKENTGASQLSAFVSVRKSSSSSQGSGSESKYDLGSEFQVDNDDLFCSTSIHDSKLGIHESKLGNLSVSRKDEENRLANDMSSLIINDQSLHKSMLGMPDKDTSISAAVIAHLNQSLINQSSTRLADFHAQNQLDNQYKSMHESRIEEQLQNFSIHQDTSTTVASQQHQNESVLNQSSVRQTNQQSYIDPWDDGLKQNLLANLQPPLLTYPGYTVIENGSPDIGLGMAVGLGNELYSICSKVGEGAFAKIYSACVLDAEEFELEGGDRNVALKVERPPCPWEFYISKQLQERVKMAGGVDVSKSLMDIENAYLYDDSSCLVTDLHTSGTLLDAINQSGKDSLKGNEMIISYFAIELIHMIEKMHASQIIHGDIKPDNILLINMDSDFSGSGAYPALSPNGCTKYLKLIDMGRGIDMSLFPAGTQFNTRSGTSGFECIEMQMGKPWTYQTDLYGLAGTLFCMLCGTYMKAYQEGGRWKTTAKWKRFWKADWKGILDKLLNIPSCQELPSLASIRQELEDVFNNYYKKSKFEEAMNNLSETI